MVNDTLRLLAHRVGSTHFLCIYNILLVLMPRNLPAYSKVVYVNFTAVRQCALLNEFQYQFP